MLRARHAAHSEISDLNLVPYMDIMVNLIIFMLLSMTAFFDMNIINVSVPQIPDTEERDTTRDHPPPPELEVVLEIAFRQGFNISLDGELIEGPGENRTTVPCLSTHDFDFDGLRDKLTEVKRRAPTVSALTIVPDSAVDYTTLVTTMDTIRRDADGRQLFPDVLLGVH